jgi:hypothetical protein
MLRDANSVIDMVKGQWPMNALACLHKEEVNILYDST